MDSHDKLTAVGIRIGASIALFLVAGMMWFFHKDPSLTLPWLLIWVPCALTIRYLAPYALGKPGYPLAATFALLTGPAFRESAASAMSWLLTIFVFLILLVPNETWKKKERDPEEHLQYD